MVDESPFEIVTYGASVSFTNSELVLNSTCESFAPATARCAAFAQAACLLACDSKAPGLACPEHPRFHIGWSSIFGRRE